MSTSHLINANIHRAKEGARVLEDIARFILRDEQLFSRIRNIRHSIQISAPVYNTADDLGGVSLIEDNVRFNIVNIIQANAIRVQEALRVLEEMSTTATNKQKMKELRYNAYDIHSKIYYSAQQYLRLQSLKGLYLIIDTDVITYPIEQIAEIINISPVSIVQYRNKSTSKQSVFDGATKFKQLLDPKKLFIINDHIDIALDLADGVHIGQEDYPLERIRNIIPNDFILGISCHSIAEAHAAVQYGTSYLAMGCLFDTKSKNNTIPVSIKELRTVCNEVTVPVCGIGGINSTNLDQVLTANIKMAALISYVWKTENPLQAINDMHERICTRLI